MRWFDGSTMRLLEDLQAGCVQRAHDKDPGLNLEIYTLIRYVYKISRVAPQAVC